MEVVVTTLVGVPLLTVTGDVDHLTAPALEGSIQRAFLLNGMRLLLDLAGCPYLDSGGLSVLLYALREVKGKGWLGVIAPSGNLLRLFEITGLTADPDFRVFRSSKEAPATLEV
jgi:anti-sigma B factor antagonist